MRHSGCKFKQTVILQKTQKMEVFGRSINVEVFA